MNNKSRSFPDGGAVRESFLIKITRYKNLSAQADPSIIQILGIHLLLSKCEKIGCGHSAHITRFA